MCVLPFDGGPPGFPGFLHDGVWLVGWSGGLDHYSWMKFEFQTATTGTFTWLDPMGVTLTPYFACEGSGTFLVQPGYGSVILDLPLTCGAAKTVLDFTATYPVTGSPPHATLGASISHSGMLISGFQHPATFCDQAFTMCGDPFQP